MSSPHSRPAFRGEARCTTNTHTGGPPRPPTCQVVAEHLYHEGQFEIGDCFVVEAGLAEAERLKRPYASMHTVLQQVGLFGVPVQLCAYLSPTSSPRGLGTIGARATAPPCTPWCRRWVCRGCYIPAFHPP